MRLVLIWVMAPILLFGCLGQPESTSDEAELSARIDQWQARENIVIPESIMASEMDYDGIDDIRRNICKRFSYISDLEKWGVYDHWETYEEALQGMEGDCEELGNLIFISALLEGYPRDQLGCVIFRTQDAGGEYSHHVSACIFSPNHGKILYVVDDAGTVPVFLKSGYEPRIAFTLDSRWGL